MELAGVDLRPSHQPRRGECLLAQHRDTHYRRQLRLATECVDRAADPDPVTTPQSRIARVKGVDSAGRVLVVEGGGIPLLLPGDHTFHGPHVARGHPAKAGNGDGHLQNGEVIRVAGLDTEHEHVVVIGCHHTNHDNLRANGPVTESQARAVIAEDCEGSSRPVGQKHQLAPKSGVQYAVHRGRDPHELTLELVGIHLAGGDGPWRRYGHRSDHAQADDRANLGLPIERPYGASDANAVTALYGRRGALERRDSPSSVLEVKASSVPLLLPGDHT